MNILIANVSDPPIYRQIADQIKEAVFKGELKQDDPLPSVRTLAAELRISVITTRRAYEELEAEGIIVSIQGKGSFVSGVDMGLMREAKLNKVETLMAETVNYAKSLGVSRAELTDMLTLLFEEDR